MRTGRKSFGPYVAMSIRNLKKSGLSGATLDTAIEAIRGQTKARTMRLPRKVSAIICSQLEKYQRIVVVNKSPKMFKVYSLDGYISSKAASKLTANKHKPWEYAKKSRSESAS